MKIKKRLIKLHYQNRSFNEVEIITDYEQKIQLSQEALGWINISAYNVSLSPDNINILIEQLLELSNQNKYKIPNDNNKPYDLNKINR